MDDCIKWKQKQLRHDTHSNRLRLKYTDRQGAFYQSLYSLCANKLYNPP
jgi:hypothetical protein